MQFRLFIRVLREPLESAPCFFSPILPGKHAINSSSESNSFCGDWFGRIDSTAWKARFLEHGRKSLWELLYFKSIDAKRAQKMATSPNLCIKVDEPSHDRDTIQMLLIYMLYWIVLSTLVETEKRANVSSYVLLFFWNSILNSFIFRTKFMRFKTKTFYFLQKFLFTKIPFTVFGYLPYLTCIFCATNYFTLLMGSNNQLHCRPPNLRKQPTFGDATIGFPAKWRRRDHFVGETSGGIAMREMSAVFSGCQPPTIRLYTMMWMLPALWLVIAYDLSHYRYIDHATGNLFSLFCSTWRAVLKMFLRLFRIKESESLEKSLAGAIYKEEKWRYGDKKSSWPLKDA